jgi:hypothetical protein
MSMGGRYDAYVVFARRNDSAAAVRRGVLVCGLAFIDFDLISAGRLNGDIVQRIVVPVFGDDFMKGMFTGAAVTMRAVHG